MAYSNNPLNNYETEIVTHQSNAGNVNSQYVFKIKILPKNNAVLLVNDFKVKEICGTGVNLNGDNLYSSLVPMDTPHLKTNTYEHFFKYDALAPQYSPVSMQFCIFTDTSVYELTQSDISGSTINFNAIYPDIEQIVFYEVYLDDNGNDVNSIDLSLVPVASDFNQTFVDSHFWNSTTGSSISNTDPIRIEAIVYLNQNIQFPLTQYESVDFDFDQIKGTPIVYGCLDPLAYNYNANATIHNAGLCEYAGCDDSSAGDFPDINGNDINGDTCTGTLVTLLDGTTVNLCDSGEGYLNVNYDPGATINPNNDCVTAVLGCTDILYQEYDPLATVDDGSCTNLVLIPGCIDDTAGTNPIRVMLAGATEYQWLCRDGSVPVNGTTNLVTSVPYPAPGVEQGNGGYCDSAAGGWSTLTYAYDENGDSNGSGVLSHDQSYCLYCTNYGCGDSNYVEYDASIYNDYLDDICIDNSLCLTLIVSGCTDGPSSSTITNVNGALGAINYDPLANTDDGSCYYFPGCNKTNYLEYYNQTDSTGNNYLADFDDGSCLTYKVDGCTDPNDANYPTGCGGDYTLGTCWIVSGGLYDDGINPQCCPNYDDGSCAGTPGCMDDTPGTNPDIYGNCRTSQSYDALQFGIGPAGPGYLNVNTNIYISPTNDTFVGQLSCDGCEDTLVNPESGYLNINHRPDATYDDGSCGECGCTDPTADNYDSTALSDDGSCTYTSSQLLNLRPMLKNGSVNNKNLNPYDFYYRHEKFQMIDSNGIITQSLGPPANNPSFDIAGSATIVPGNFNDGVSTAPQGGYTTGFEDPGNSSWNAWYSSTFPYISKLDNPKQYTNKFITEDQLFTGKFTIMTALAGFDFEENARQIANSTVSGYGGGSLVGKNPLSLGFSAVGSTYDATTNRWSGGDLPAGVELEFEKFFEVHMTPSYLNDPNNSFNHQPNMAALIRGPRNIIFSGNSSEELEFLILAYHTPNIPSYSGQNFFTHFNSTHTAEVDTSSGDLNTTGCYFLKTKIHLNNWPSYNNPPNHRGDGLDTNQLAYFTNTDETLIDGLSTHMNYIPEFNYTCIYGCTNSTPSVSGGTYFNDYPDVDGNGVDGNTWVLGDGNGFQHTNYNPNANVDDGSCCGDDPNSVTAGCMDPLADNYEPTACIDDGSCQYTYITPPSLVNCDIEQAGWFYNGSVKQSDAYKPPVCSVSSGWNDPTNNDYFWQPAHVVNIAVTGGTLMNNAISGSYDGTFARGTGQPGGYGLFPFSNGLEPPVSTNWKGFGSKTEGILGASWLDAWPMCKTNSFPTFFFQSSEIYAANKSYPNVGFTFGDGLGDYSAVYSGGSNVGNPTPGAYQFDFKDNSQVSSNDTRLWWFQPMLLTGPAWSVNGYSNSTLSTGGSPNPGNKSFTSMYRSIDDFDSSQDYKITITIYVDAPGTNQGPNGSNYNNQFAFNIGWAGDGNALGAGSPGTTIQWIRNQTEAPNPGYVYTSIFDENDIQFTPTGNTDDRVLVTGMSTTQNTWTENPLIGNEYEEWIVERTFTTPSVVTGKETLAISMIEGTRMFITMIKIIPV